MPLFSRSVTKENTSIGYELVDYLTGDAVDLAPRISGLTPAGAGALVVQAGRHGVGPLLRNRLIELGLFDALPAPAVDDLEAQYVSSSAQAMARYHELAIILDRLAEARVPVIALKGIYLAKALYPELGLRPMSDIDLLFREQDLEQVQALLFALGYTGGGADRPITDWLPDRLHLPPFERQGATHIEVHMHIARPNAPFRIDREGLWRRARPSPLGRHPMLALAPEDLLLHLCLHGMHQHRFRIRLNGLVDIARVLDAEPLDWDVFVGRAQNWGASLSAFLGLELSRRLVHAEVPSPVLSALAPIEDTEAVLAHAERIMLTERSEDDRRDMLSTVLSALAPIEDTEVALAHAERIVLTERSEDDRRDMLSTEINQYAGYLRKMAEMHGLPGERTKVAFLFSKAFPRRDVLERQYPRFNGSRWVGVMYSVHWLIVAGRFTRAMAVNWRYWLSLRRL